MGQEFDGAHGCHLTGNEMRHFRGLCVVDPKWVVDLCGSAIHAEGVRAKLCDQLATSTRVKPMCCILNPITRFAVNEHGVRVTNAIR